MNLYEQCKLKRVRSIFLCDIEYIDLEGYEGKLRLEYFSKERELNAHSNKIDWTEYLRTKNKPWNVKGLKASNRCLYDCIAVFKFLDHWLGSK